jgi:two-component system cell cycle sensor histidine kinase/response regulator CckA
VGQLAAGIAHDFNNILATIVLYTQMSLRANETSPQVRQRLEIIARQTDRATDLVQQILDFSRRAMLKRRVLALDSFMKEVVKLLERTLPESIHISLAVEAGEYPINADLTRIQQAIVNLALNARDAMPNGGELRIALSRTQGQEIQCVDCGPMTGGDWIQVTVTDTGTGIPPDVLPHIFEPFFTTRTPLGHGLGLAQVHGIVKQHEGHLDVQTQVGHGTTFRLYWPALSAGQPLALPEAPLEMAQGRGETILVVEDDDTMRAALIDVLDALDYQVLAAANGMEALVVYEQYADEVSLILSDWVMPSIGGLELVRELAARHAAPKVLMLTGHPLAEEAETSVPVNVVGWILKPPSIEQLAEAVSRALTEGK